MFKTLANAWKIQDLRNKFLFTVVIILIYRIGACITVPFIDIGQINYQTHYASGSSILGFLNTLSGGALSNATLFALGVSPYITSSIVIQLLTVAIPALERLSKEGEEGKRKITVITRYVTMIIAFITAVGYYLYLKNTVHAVSNTGFFAGVVIIACYCAGSALVMWLAERINDKGIGNGISMILFANIVSRGSAILTSIVGIFNEDLSGNGHVVRSTIYTILVAAGMLAMIWFVIFISDSERRIPVQYAKKVVGRKMYGGQNTNLPLKLNMTGVMPIIFANSIVTIPATIAMFATPAEGSFWEKVVNFCSNTSWFYALMTFILILAFAYFYVAISFNPVEVAGNLQKNGGSIPGIRPGKATAQFIQKVLSKVTLIGALALSVIAVLPLIAQLIMQLLGNVNDFYTYAVISDLVFGGSSVIIVVGVILETVRDVEAQMTMRHYKGFLG
ncbi:MAG: preprotein translocase subunit SecY [Clostridia bacterium]|nr:preprotein translocase subunit SecY [Clostridia bacterium]